MLYEADIVDAVCKELQRLGYRIAQKLETKEQGDDIIASCTDVNQRLIRLYVEAKGETGSDESSNRFGKPFSDAQVRDHVANAVCTAMEMMSRSSSTGVKAAIALPDTPSHRRCVGRVFPALAKLEIGIFWVKPDRTVEIQNMSITATQL